MSTNCLVTKLKAEVNNPGLPILNGLIFETKAAENVSAVNRKLIFPDIKGTIESFDETDACLSFNQDFSNPSNKLDIDYTVSGHTTVYITQGVHKVVFKNKYDLECINKMGSSDMSDPGNYSESSDISLNIDDMAYADGLKSIVGAFNVKGNIASFLGKTIFRINLVRSGTDAGPGDMEGDLIDFLNKAAFDPNGAGDFNLRQYTELTGNGQDWETSQPYIKRFGIYSCRNSNLILTLKQINDKMPNLTHLILRDTTVSGDLSELTVPLEQISTIATNVLGSLEGFALAQYSKDRISGECLSAGGWNNGITFGGSSAQSWVNGTLKWRPTTSSISGAVLDVCETYLNRGYVFDSNGNSLGEITPW